MVNYVFVDTRSQVPARAEYNFLDRVRWLDMYGVELHPVKVRLDAPFLSVDCLDLNLALLTHRNWSQ